MNQIHALLITAPDLVRHAFRAMTGQRLVNTLAEKTRPRDGRLPSRRSSPGRR